MGINIKNEETQRLIRELAKLAKKNGQASSPVRLEGRKIASTFWGKAWCDNLEAYSDYANRLPRGRRPGLVKIFVGQFKSPLIYVLLLATLVSLALREWSDAGFIFVVLLVNALIGTFQEYRAERSARALSELTAPRARVVRDGDTVEIATLDELVDLLLDRLGLGDGLLEIFQRQAELVGIEPSKPFALRLEALGFAQQLTKARIELAHTVPFGNRRIALGHGLQRKGAQALDVVRQCVGKRSHAREWSTNRADFGELSGPPIHFIAG